MVTKQTIIFFLTAPVLVAGSSISFSFWGMNGDSRLIHQASLSGNSNNTVTATDVINSIFNDTFQVLPDPNPPRILDGSLRAEKVIAGLESPTSMAFLDHDDILIVQKDNGRVRLVSNGVLQPNPIFNVAVRNDSEQGLLGVAIANITSTILYGA
jgi:glucose/arabinose dehydrogenase